MLLASCLAASRPDNIAGAAAILADESSGGRDNIQKSTLFKIWLQCLLKGGVEAVEQVVSQGFSPSFNMHSKTEIKREES